MHFFSRFARAPQPRIAHASDPNDLTPAGSRAVHIAATIAALGLIFCAAAQNVSYGWQLGAARSEIAGYILAGGALAAAVMSPICLMVAFSEHRRFTTRLAALFLGLWCLSYGVSASLGFVSTSREAMNSERAGAIEARHQAKARHDAAAAELAQINSGKSTQWRAARARELQAVMVEATKAMKTEKAVAVADPQAQALSHYLAAAGFAVTPESVSTWTTAFTTAFYEVAGAFALIVARAAGSHGTTQPKATGAPAGGNLPASQVPANRETRAGDAAGRSSDDDEQGPDDQPPPSKGKPGRRPTVLPAQAIERLRQKGGKAAGSVNGIGKLLGTRSKTTAHRLLHQMASAGLVTLTRSTHGMRVALA